MRAPRLRFATPGQVQDRVAGRRRGCYSRRVQNLLTRKEVRSLRGIHPTTLYRWEKDGLLFLKGRISEADLVFFLERAEAARKLGMKAREMMTLPRREQERLLARALYGATEEGKTQRRGGAEGEDRTKSLW